MAGPKYLTIYLDQNLLGDLLDGAPAKSKVENALAYFREKGAVYVYSDVHVEECRAFYEPKQFVQVIRELNGYYLPSKGEQVHDRVAKPNMAKELLLRESDFEEECVIWLNHHLLISQYMLGWLGELEAKELVNEIGTGIDIWAAKAERETQGLFKASIAREQLLDAFLSIDLDKLKREGFEIQPRTEREWNQRFSLIDATKPEDIVELVFSLIDDEAAQYLRRMFPKGAWPHGAYHEPGTLTGLAFFLFCQGVGRDSKVKSGTQTRRRNRFLAQYRDCRHIEEAASCSVLLSRDRRAIKLARAVYCYAGVETVAKEVTILKDI